MKKYKLIKCKNPKLVSNSLTVAIIGLGATICVLGCKILIPSNSEIKVTQIIDGDELFKPLDNQVNYDPEINIVYVDHDDYVKEETNIEVLEPTSNVQTDVEPTFIEEIEEIKHSNETDSEIIDENNSDMLSIYFQKLEEINENNSIKDVNMEQYLYDNYETLLYDNNSFNDSSLEYAALAYKRLLDNNVDLYAAIDEFNTIMELQLNPTELDEATYNETFKTLLKTININEENVYDIYFILAKQVHIVNCNYPKEQHYIASDGVTYCDELVDGEKSR